LIDCGPNYEKKAYLRPKDQLGLDVPVLNSTIGSVIFEKMALSISLTTAKLTENLNL
jgi:hypothetical protein